MKKIMSNIRIMAALLVAGAAFAACTSDDNSIDQQPAQTVAEGQHQYNLTIQAGKGDASTRALELDGTALVAKWTAGDIVKVYSGTTEVGELTASEVSADGQTCKLKGTITGSIAVNDQLTLTYHPYDTSSLSAIQAAFNAQTGTLASAAALDCATATVTVASITANEGGTSSDISISETSATFATETAVLKVTMTTDGSTAIDATSLAMKVGSTDVFTFAPTAATYTANGSGIVYLALPKPALLATAMNTDATTLSTSSVLFTASNSTTTYVASKTGYAFAASKYYATSLTMAVNLAALTTDYTAQNGDILTGTLDVENYPVKISIADGATVTLKDVTIEGVDNENYPWAGITCLGSATINLEGTNTVKGFYANYPGIYVPHNNEDPDNEYTLTIQSPSGTGKLTASNSGTACGSGIGGGFNISCGNITINSGEITATSSNGTGIGSGVTVNSDSFSSCGNITINGGTVTATGGDNYPGIGCGYVYGKSSSCGNITINGGTVTATGGYRGAGIGCGWVDGGGTFSCGSITISSNVTKVVATKGAQAFDCIGKGYSTSATFSFGEMTIGGTLVEGAFYYAVIGTVGTFSQTNYENDTWTYEPQTNN